MISERVVESLSRGTDFMRRGQLPSGEFPTMKWLKSDTCAVSYVPSVFITSFVLHSLKHIATLARVEDMCQSAIKFLLDQMEHDSLWRFGGKNSNIHFDMDTTCCVLASLKEWGVKMNYFALASALLNYRNSRGLFYTWILDVDPPFQKEDNNIDWVVNANVLFFYSLLGLCQPEVEQYLGQVVETDTFRERSPYYDSASVFAYCLARVVVNDRNSSLNLAVAKMKDYLLSLESTCNILDPLDHASATVALLNSVDNGWREAEGALTRLIHAQDEDGGWPKGALFTGGPYTGHSVLYGSRELTTAIALEAMCRYLKLRLLVTA